MNRYLAEFSQWDTLYYSYRALHRNQYGQLVTKFVSNDSEKIEHYRSSLREYRDETNMTLTEILRRLSERLAEESELAQHQEL